MGPGGYTYEIYYQNFITLKYHGFVYFFGLFVNSDKRNQFYDKIGIEP